MEAFLVILILFLIIANYYWAIVPVIITIIGMICDNIVLGLIAGGISFIVLFVVKSFSK